MLTGVNFFLVRVGSVQKVLFSFLNLLSFKFFFINKSLLVSGNSIYVSDLILLDFIFEFILVVSFFYFFFLVKGFMKLIIKLLDIIIQFGKFALSFSFLLYLLILFFFDSINILLLFVNFCIEFR